MAFRPPLPTILSTITSRATGPRGVDFGPWPGAEASGFLEGKASDFQELTARARRLSFVRGSAGKLRTKVGKKPAGEPVEIVKEHGRWCAQTRSEMRPAIAGGA